MTAILGISAFYHDSAAALVIDGDIVAAAQEERFTRKKHDDRFPELAVAYCLQQAGLRPEQLDYVAFYDKPLTKFERLLETYFAFAPRGFLSFRHAMPIWLKEKLHLRRALRKGVNVPRRCPLVFLDHHESHAASAFFPSPFDEAAILTVDGVGEWSTATSGIGTGNKIQLTHHLQFPHSLGLLYSAFTYYCGFKVNSGEYKLMGLAPYGQPHYAEAIFRDLIDLKPDGSFRMNMDYFNYCQGLTMTGRKFHRLFGGPPRQQESLLEQRHMDLAASIQAVTEEILLRMCRDLQRRTRMKNLVLAGGVALNCVANGRILREGPFESLWIQPAAGDAGGALGSALFVWHQLLDRPRTALPHDSQKGSFLGPAFASSDIERFLASHPSPPEGEGQGVRGRGEGVRGEIVSERIADAGQRCALIARLLDEGKVIGWFQGRMEFGPRSLGARSILGDARSPRMQAALNLKVKFRESFRPFAPIVMQEYAHEWFEMQPGLESPYMLLVAGVHERQRLTLDPDQEAKMRSDPDLRQRVNIPRSTIPAVTHVDCSARVQTVDAARNPALHQLLTAFHELTGCPVLVNTSFNVRGEPIVCTPADAYRCFQATEMDVLVLEDYVIHKQGKSLDSQREEHLARFQLD